MRRIALLLLLLWPSLALGHKVKQARVIHMVLHGNTLELYVNLLLPKTAKTRLWIALFDRNRNRRLEPKEQKALGAYLKRFALKNIALTHRKKAVTFRFKELQNSRHRGDPRKGSYCWDYRLQARLKLKPGRHPFQLKLKPLFVGEIVPVALVAMGKDRLKRTKTSYVLRRNQKDRSLCKLHKPTSTCRFLLHRPATPKRPK